MATLERPKLRPLPAQRFDHDGLPYALIQDPAGAFSNPVLVPLDAFVHVCRHFDGRRTLSDIQSRILQETGQLFILEMLQGLVDQLDKAMVLDGPTFASYKASFRESSVRPAALAGRSYAGDAVGLRTQIGQYFVGPGGAGDPTAVGSNSGPRQRVRAVVSPHIDFNRGGPVYSWAYKELADERDVDTFVILGV